MKKVKNLNPIQESILRMGKSKRIVNENFDVNHPIGVLPHADAVATEQHIEDRKAGLERLANPAKDPVVKELIDETASEKSRTLHYDVIDRKGLSFILTEAKKNNQTFKVRRSDKEGYRYRVDVSPILVEDINDKKDIKKDLDNYLKWCKDNNKKAEDSKSLEEFTNSTQVIKESYKTPVNDSDEYVNAMYKAYKELKNRKNGYAAVYGYMKDKKFTPLLAIKDSQTELNNIVKSLRTREKGKTDVTVYTLFKNNLEGAEEMLKEKGLIKKSLKEGFKGNFDILLDDILSWFDDHAQAREDLIKYLEIQGYTEDDIKYLFVVDKEDILEESYDDFDYYKEQLEDLPLDEEDFDYYLEKLYEVADKDEYADYKSFSAVIKDARSTAKQYEEDEDLDESCNKQVKEDLQLYTPTLKDFKPAKQAKELWDEIVEKDKLEDLEYELENVFKTEDESTPSISVEGLNDLLINHPDFIRTLIDLDGEEDDEEFTEEPIDNMDLVIEDEEDEEPLEDSEIEDEDDENIEVFEEEESEDDEDEKNNEKKDLSLKKKFNEEVSNINNNLDKNISIVDHEEPKPENADDEDTITEKVANEFIKTRKKIQHEKLDENVPLLSSAEDEEEIIDVNDEEIDEALGMPSKSKEVK